VNTSNSPSRCPALPRRRIAVLCAQRVDGIDRVSQC
jgi:hypothetical protein